MIFFPPHNFAQCAICLPQILFAAFRIQILSTCFVFSEEFSPSALQRMHHCLPQGRKPPGYRTCQLTQNAAQKHISRAEARKMLLSVEKIHNASSFVEPFFVLFN
jgi:hypothetical protein